MAFKTKMYKVAMAIKKTIKKEAKSWGKNCKKLFCASASDENDEVESEVKEIGPTSEFPTLDVSEKVQIPEERIKLNPSNPTQLSEMETVKIVLSVSYTAQTDIQIHSHDSSSTDVNTVKTERGDCPEAETILKLNRAEFEREMLYNRNSRQAVRDHMNKSSQDKFNKILLLKEKRSRLILEHLDINLCDNCNNLPIDDINSCAEILSFIELPSESTDSTNLPKVKDLKQIDHSALFDESGQKTFDEELTIPAVIDTQLIEKPIEMPELNDQQQDPKPVLIAVIDSPDILEEQVTISNDDNSMIKEPNYIPNVIDQQPNDSSNVTADIISYLSQKLDHFLICIDANCSLLIKNSTGNQEQPLVDNITEETINYLSQKIDHCLINIDANCSLFIKNWKGNQKQSQDAIPTIEKSQVEDYCNKKEEKSLLCIKTKEEPVLIAVIDSPDILEEQVTISNDDNSMIKEPNYIPNVIDQQPNDHSAPIKSSKKKKKKRQKYKGYKNQSKYEEAAKNRLEKNNMKKKAEIEINELKSIKSNDCLESENELIFNASEDSSSPITVTEAISDCLPTKNDANCSLLIKNWTANFEELIDTLENALDSIHGVNVGDDLKNYIESIEFSASDAEHGINVTFIDPYDSDRLLELIRPGFLIYNGDGTSFEPVLSRLKKSGELDF